MNPIIHRYPLDPTGTSRDNLVENEEHQLNNRAIRIVAPTYQGFYATGVVVVDMATNLPMDHGHDYVFGELYEVPTGRYQKEIFGVIVIKKPGVSRVKISYQALGGNYSYSMDAIIAMLDNLNLGNRPVAWPNIIGKPTLFDPASHFHDLGDIYGFEYLVNALERIRSAILLGDVASHDEIYRYIDRTSVELQASITALRGDLNTHIADKTNPHQVTKTQVGLGNVANFGTATASDILNGTPNLFTSAVAVRDYVTSQVIQPLNAHVADKTNPHSTTKAQVGLGNVIDYAVATQQQMDSGATNAYVTPNTVRAYIQSAAVLPMTEHIADRSNPHQTTKAQVGLSLVDNYATATDVISQAGLSNNNFMTPRLVRDEITRLAITPLNTHAARTDNPHQTTKVQVGLGNVIDLGLATQDQMNNGASGVYATPNIIYNWVQNVAVLPLNAHIGRLDNPHQTNKVQIGLGNVANYGVAVQADMNAGSATNLYVTPNIVALYVNQQAVQPLTAHTNRVDNPHNTTKVQVGLGNVANFSPASVSDAQAGWDNNTYATPYNVRNYVDAQFLNYLMGYKSTLQEARDGARDNVWISPWLMNVVIGERLGNYYTRADVDYLINQALLNNQTVATYGNQSFVYAYSSSPSGVPNLSLNFFDVFPPSGKSMSNLQAFIPSTNTIYYAGDVDGNDTLFCQWAAMADRVRVWVGNSEQRGAAAANWMAIWK